jgi:dihydrodipicolinate synthase/N-acetylneuraminate lyase
MTRGGDGFSGIIPPLVTPLAGPDSLDIAGLERLIEHVIGGDVSGIFVLGTTGEAAGLSHRLRQEVIEASCGIVAQRVPVFVGITDTSYVETAKLARMAADAGASALVVAPPYYFTYTQDDLLRYVEQLAADVRLPLFLYNIPQLTKLRFEVETVRRAAQVAGIAGLKDSSGDLIYLRQVIEAVRSRPDFQVFIGPEEMLVNAVRMGACGGVTGGANLFPQLFVGLFQLAEAGDWEQAESLQQVVREIAGLLYTIGDASTSYMRGLKAALSCRGICSDLPARPLAVFSAGERDIIATRLDKARAMISTATNSYARLSS